MNKIILVIFSFLLFSNNVLAVCYSTLIKSTPDSRFEINNNGTVLDKKTGLMWMRCTLGQVWDGMVCLGSATNYNWEQSFVVANNQSFANLSDWRLPNIKELSSIMELACVQPAINENIFPNTVINSTTTNNAILYRTSTPFSNTENFVGSWYVDFNGVGEIPHYRIGPGVVRLVREANVD